jgi:hypothetical protein
MFYNNPVSSSQYFIEAQFSPANRTVTASNENVYPYFDNYNVVTGSFPSSGSRSLLFNNETATLGSTPTENLISEYWSTYINLLYDPRTRLVNATAVIPLAKYFDMELNDLVQFRGNYYHLRAINDYDLTTGECLVQLLGPIISDALAAQQFGTAVSGSIPPDPGTCCAPTITSITGSGANINIFFTTSSGCAECTATTVQSSTNGVTWGSNNTGGCDSPRTITAPTGSTYYRMFTNCASGATSSFSNTGSYTPPVTPSPTGSQYNYYEVSKYNCFPCSLNTTGLIARTTASVFLTTGNYYNNGDGYVYVVTNSDSGPSYTVDLYLAASAGTDCNLTCAI